MIHRMEILRHSLLRLLSIFRLYKPAAFFQVFSSLDVGCWMLDVERFPCPAAVRRRRIHFLSSILVLALCGCSTAPLPPANLSAPGWTVQQGQALWKPTATRPEIAGDLIMATNTDGDCFIQFTKTPFTIATAQISGSHWQLTFGNDQHSWRGSGTPISRFVWLQLPRAFAGAPIAPNWQFHPGANGWQFQNPHTGESLEGEFFQ